MADPQADPIGGPASERSVDEASRRAAELARCGAFAQLAADHNPDTILVIDPDGAVRYAGGAIGNLVGLTPEQALTASIWDFIHPADLESAAGALNEASRNDGYHMPTEFRIRGHEGQWVDAEVTGTTFGSCDGAWLVLTIRMTAYRNEVIRRRDEIEAVVREASTVLSGVSWTDVDDAVSDFGQQLASVVGADSFSMAWTDEGDTLYGAGWPTWIRNIDGGRFDRLWPRDMLAGSLMQFTDDLMAMPPTRARELLLANGARAAVEIPLTGEPLWGVARLTFRHSSLCWDDANVDLVKVLATALMSTVRRCRFERALHDRASTDPLTGLMNRTELYRHIEESVDSDGLNGDLAVLFGDLDNFKMINDVHGHAAGDDLLIEVANVLRESVRAVDVIARLGGDEFVVVCPDVENLDQVHSIADRIVRAVEGIDTRGVPIAMSLGMAVRRSGESGQELLQRADHRMYESKKARSTVRCVAQALVL